MFLTCERSFLSTWGLLKSLATFNQVFSQVILFASIFLHLFHLNRKSTPFIFVFLLSFICNLSSYLCYLCMLLMCLIYFFLSTKRKPLSSTMDLPCVWNVQHESGICKREWSDIWKWCSFIFQKIRGRCLGSSWQNLKGCSVWRRDTRSDYTPAVWKLSTAP